MLTTRSSLHGCPSCECKPKPLPSDPCDIVDYMGVPSERCPWVADGRFRCTFPAGHGGRCHQPAIFSEAVEHAPHKPTVARSDAR